MFRLITANGIALPTTLWWRCSLGRCFAAPRLLRPPRFGDGPLEHAERWVVCRFELLELLNPSEYHLVKRRGKEGTRTFSGRSLHTGVQGSTERARSAQLSSCGAARSEPSRLSAGLLNLSPKDHLVQYLIHLSVPTPCHRSVP